MRANCASALAEGVAAPDIGGMVGGLASLTLRVHQRIADIAATEWDACAGAENPFLCHAFLSALEESGSVGAERGWLPQHLTLRNDEGRLIACVPAYLKAHSRGEYVFDQAWAEALENAGGRYYPKLQVAVPFTPVAGRRLLLAPDAAVTPAAVARTLIALCRSADLSSVHLTFCTRAEWEALGEAGWLQRLGTQFHWHNPGYRDFEDFLSALASRKRKAIRRERREVRESGLTLRLLRGAEITPRHWAAFHRFYRHTTDRKWGRSAYLTEAFWPLLGERLGERVVLMVAETDGEPVAAALNLLGQDALYGRYWGSVVEVPFLHFELCYYMAMEFAIAHRLSRVEAGAQGEHKIARGYLPIETYSVHWLAHPGLAKAVAAFLERERPAVRAAIAELAALSPFRRDER